MFTKSILNTSITHQWRQSILGCFPLKKVYFVKPGTCSKKKNGISFFTHKREPSCQYPSIYVKNFITPNERVCALLRAYNWKNRHSTTWPPINAFLLGKNNEVNKLFLHSPKILMKDTRKLATAKWKSSSPSLTQNELEKISGINIFSLSNNICRRWWTSAGGV